MGSFINFPLFIAVLISFISWLLRAYGAIQTNRSPIDKPLIWHNPLANLILILVPVGLLVISSCIAFIENGLGGILVILTLYFISYPTILGKKFTKLVEKMGL